MLDLRRDRDSAPPWHWRLAPLPEASLYLPGRDGLHRLGHRQAEPASPALLAALGAAAEPGATIAAEDSSGTLWRLRHLGQAGGQPCWQLQELGESRRRIRAALRRLLAPRLGDSVLHELRNPLNALSLHTDLIARLAAAETRGEGTAAARLSASVEVIKLRLRDLGERQDAAVALWLEDDAADAAAPVALSRLVDSSLKLARGHLLLHEVRLRGEALQGLDGHSLRRHAATLQLALMCMLLMAGAGAGRHRAADGSAEVLLLAASADGRTVLELQAALDGEALAREAADTDGEGLLAALALLLEPAAIELQPRAAEALLRLVFPPMAAAD